MKVDVIGDLGRLQEPVRMDARTVVIRDAFDQPILIAQVLEQGGIFVTRPSDPGFRDTLKTLGLDIRVKYREVKVT
jgi:hypothetical protein